MSFQVVPAWQVGKLRSEHASVRVVSREQEGQQQHKEDAAVGSTPSGALVKPTDETKQEKISDTDVDPPARDNRHSLPDDGSDREPLGGQQAVVPGGSALSPAVVGVDGRQHRALRQRRWTEAPRRALAGGSRASARRDRARDDAKRTEAEGARLDGEPGEIRRKDPKAIGIENRAAGSSNGRLGRSQPDSKVVMPPDQDELSAMRREAKDLAAVHVLYVFFRIVGAPTVTASSEPCR